MKIKMTEQDKALFEAMSKEDQDKFLNEKDEQRKNLMLKSVILTTLLIENLDDLEEFGLYREKLKVKGKPFKHQLLVYIKQVWGIEDDLNEGTDYILQISKKIDEMLK